MLAVGRGVRGFLSLWGTEKKGGGVSMKSTIIHKKGYLTIGLATNSKTFKNQNALTNLLSEFKSFSAIFIIFFDA